MHILAVKFKKFEQYANCPVVGISRRVMWSGKDLDVLCPRRPDHVWLAEVTVNDGLRTDSSELNPATDRVIISRLRTTLLSSLSYLAYASHLKLSSILCRAIVAGLALLFLTRPSILASGNCSPVFWAGPWRKLQASECCTRDWSIQAFTPCPPYLCNRQCSCVSRVTGMNSMSLSAVVSTAIGLDVK